MKIVYLSSYRLVCGGMLGLVGDSGRILVWLRHLSENDYKKNIYKKSTHYDPSYFTVTLEVNNFVNDTNITKAQCH